MEDSGRIRRGYFVAGVSGAQFALPAALDLLRSLRDRPEEADAILLAATDPANPYGVILKWPEQGQPSTAAAGATAAATASATASASVSARAAASASANANRASDAKAHDSDAPATASTRGPTRSVGAQVIIVDGQLAAYLGRGRQLFVYLPEAEPDRSRVARALAKRLTDIARTGEGRVGGLLIGEIDGAPAADHPMAPYLIEAGFVRSALGFQIIRERPRPRPLMPLERKPGVSRIGNA
jgi:ATP-dependent Lhr-like helicase